MLAPFKRQRVMRSILCFVGWVRISEDGLRRGCTGVACVIRLAGPCLSPALAEIGPEFGGKPLGTARRAIAAGLLCAVLHIDSTPRLADVLG
jgi:hypothetical protein